jgi:hypothetical protein
VSGTDHIGVGRPAAYTFESGEPRSQPYPHLLGDQQHVAVAAERRRPAGRHDRRARAGVVVARVRDAAERPTMR